jgi:RNA polymerase sigma-70 factor, ECF subfamily
MEPNQDAELVVRMQSGDREAFAGVIDRYKHHLVNYLTRLTGSRTQAEDLAQETFLRLYLSIGRYRESGRLKGYLYRIATNLSRSEFRKESARRLVSLAFLSGGNGNRPRSDPQTDLQGVETRQVLQRALDGVPLRYRVPLVLHVIEGLSYGEISRILGCREGTVKSRINRGRNKLKRKIEPYLKGVER